MSEARPKRGQTKRPKKSGQRKGTRSGRRPTSRTRSAIRIHLLSDSTGNLPRHIMSALLTQFSEDAFTLEMHNFLDDRERLDHALERAAQRPGLVFHALVQRKDKERVHARCAAGLLRAWAASIADPSLRPSSIELLASHCGTGAQAERIVRSQKERRKNAPASEGFPY